MKKAQLLKIVNPLLGVSLLWVVGTVLLHKSIPHEVYAKIHPIGGYVFTGLAVIHIILNWVWIKNYFTKRKTHEKGYKHIKP